MIKVDEDYIDIKGTTIDLLVEATTMLIELADTLKMSDDHLLDLLKGGIAEARKVEEE